MYLSHFYLINSNYLLLIFLLNVSVRKLISGETPLYYFLFILSLFVVHLYMKKSYLNVRNICVHLSHFISISEKFKFPLLQFSLIWVYANHFSLFKCPFLFKLFTEFYKLKNKKKFGFLSSTTYTICWYINNLHYATIWFCFTVNFSLYGLELVKIYIIITF